jgi:hypothetical protein
LVALITSDKSVIFGETMNLLFCILRYNNTFDWGSKKNQRKYGYRSHDALNVSNLKPEYGLVEYYKRKYDFDLSTEFFRGYQNTYIDSLTKDSIVQLLPEKPRFYHLKDYVFSTDYIRTTQVGHIFSSRLIQFFMENGANNLIYCPVRIYLENDCRESITEEMFKDMEYTDDFSIVFPPDATRILSPQFAHLSDFELNKMYLEIRKYLPLARPDDLPSMFGCLHEYHGIYVTDQLRKKLQSGDIRGSNLSFYPVFQGFEILEQFYQPRKNETQSEFESRLSISRELGFPEPI